MTEGGGVNARTFTIAGQAVAAPTLAAGLHVVATPIGNLGDMTVRALETLAAADLVACEDTRITSRLIERYGIKATLTPYHDHNAETARPRLLSRIADGARIALVSDAGTPLISDPGFKLVRDAHAAGHAVFAVPGASSVMAALAVAGLPTDRFLFDGFLPAREVARRKRITELAVIDATLVLFESGSRLAASLRDLATQMESRHCAICRELTKLHEEISRGTLGDLSARATTLETRGEFVLVIEPPAEDARRLSIGDVDELLREALRHGSLKDAVAQAAAASGRSRRDVYARALELVKAADAAG